MKNKWSVGIPLVLLIILLLSISTFAQYRKEMHHAYQRVADESQVLITENGEIEYGIIGEGKPVLLIHGAGGGYDQGLLMGQAFFRQRLSVYCRFKIWLFRFIHVGKFH